MCVNKTLHYSQKGYAIYCQSCGHIRVAFGTTSVLFTEKQFDEFYHYLQDFFPKYDRTCEQKAIYLPITPQSVAWVLTGRELYELRKMVVAARDKFSYFKLLENLTSSLN